MFLRYSCNNKRRNTYACLLLRIRRKKEERKKNPIITVSSIHMKVGLIKIEHALHGNSVFFGESFKYRLMQYDEVFIE